MSMMTGSKAVFKHNGQPLASLANGDRGGISTPLAIGERGSPKRRIALYATGLAVLAASVLVSLVAVGAPFSERGDWWPVVAFALLAAVAERESIRLSQSLEISAAFLPLTFTAVVFGPIAAGLVGGAALLGELPLWHRRATADVAAPYSRWIVWTANRALDGAVAGLAAQAVLAIDIGRPLQIAAATCTATVAVFAVDLFVTSATLVVRRSGRPRDVVRDATTVAAAGIPIYTAITALLAYAYLEITPLSAAFFFIPALAAHRLFAVTQSQRAALAELGEAFRRLETANVSFATALVATLDARDRYTAGHSEAVAIYARDIAVELGCEATDQQLVDLCGLVHDIGKIGLPPGLLEKPGSLTPDERRQMEEHSAIGERILANVEDYAQIALIVRHHHERWDGNGYPDRLSAEAIPLISRILAVADAYDAMTSHRPYRAALPNAEARRRLREGAGSQFDPDIVYAFEAVLERADSRYLAGRTSAEFTSQARREPAIAMAS